MRSFLCIVMCLCMASMATALSITNGDFESQSGTVEADILDWFDYGGPNPPTNLDYDQGPFFVGYGAYTMNGTKVAYMGKEANADEDGGNHAYVYQSIGIYDGNPPVAEIEFDWGMGPNYPVGKAGVTIMILESDGTFEPNEWDGAAHDIYGFVKTDEKPDNPITEIGRGSVFGNLALGEIKHERFQIDLTSVTIGNELFLRFNNIKGDVVPWVNVDNITLSMASAVNQSPKNGAKYVATELASAENDLVFDIADPDIIAVDILFAPDNEPNLSTIPEYKIVDGMSVTQGQNTITLETELAEDLLPNRDYFWKILAYEDDGSGGLSLKYTGFPTSFKTIQEGPLLTGVTPELQGVWPGEDAVFSLEYYNKTDTFQWYKEGDPDVALSNGADYAGVDSNSLTIFSSQTEDEGVYYCVGTETATGLTAQSETRGELAIKELKSYYPFDDLVGGYTPDIIGGKDMQLMGGASLGDTDSIAGFGKYLSLVNDRETTHTQYGIIADATVAHHREITISCWVKPTILDLDYERFARIFDFGKEGGSTDDYFYLTLFQNTNEAYCEMQYVDDENETNQQDFDGDGEIGYGTKWLYVVLTVGDYLEIDDETGEEETVTRGKIYINGEYGGSGGVFHPSDIPDKSLNYIGKAISDENSPPNFDGLIDEFKIFNFAKTAEEIAKEYMVVREEVEFICDVDTYNDNDLENWDFNGNCKVDLPDFIVIAEKWLQNYLVYND